MMRDSQFKRGFVRVHSAGAESIRGRARSSTRNRKVKITLPKISVQKSKTFTLTSAN